MRSWANNRGKVKERRALIAKGVDPFDAPDALGVLDQVIGFRVLVQLGLDSSQFDGSKGDHGMIRWADDLPVVQPQLSKPLGNFPIFGSCGWVEEMDWSILSPTGSDH